MVLALALAHYSNHYSILTQLMFCPTHHFKEIEYSFQKRVKTIIHPNV